MGPGGGSPHVAGVHPAVAESRIWFGRAKPVRPIAIFGSWSIIYYAHTWSLWRTAVLPKLLKCILTLYICNVSLYTCTVSINLLCIGILYLHVELHLCQRASGILASCALVIAITLHNRKRYTCTMINCFSCLFLLLAHCMLFSAWYAYIIQY